MIHTLPHTQSPQNKRQSLLPRDIKLLRFIGEQRLITEEEIDPRDGGKARGAFGKIRNPGARGRAGQQQPYKDQRTLGTGACVCVCVCDLLLRYKARARYGGGAWL